jgi:ferredoxin-NADP reductase
MTARHLQVTGTADETPSIRLIELAAADASVLPAYTAGAHLTIDIPGIGIRKYSIINGSPTLAATVTPRAYTLGVRLDEAGGGGSKYMHQLRIGDTVQISGPGNEFPLKLGGAAPLLIGGGIGITPLISMAAELKSKAQPFKLIYAVRNRTELAFLELLEKIAGADLEVHVDEERGHLLDVETRLASLETGPVYMCGPKPMLKAGVTASRKLGWPQGRLMFELFYSAAPAKPAPTPTASAVADGSFEVELKSTGKILKIPQDKSILDVLIEDGADPMHDCKRGECGVCQVKVISGVPDHRDAILSDTERASNSLIQICISRSKSPKLVLDL